MNDKKNILASLATELMLGRDLEPGFSKDALEQVNQINEYTTWDPQAVDLRSFLWCSIDNDDSLDLDQLSYGEKEKNGNTTIWVAIADVDSLVRKNTPIDMHAAKNTTSVYTPGKIFAMLPEKLSTNLTSLNENVDRPALVVKMSLDSKGIVTDSSIFQAIVRNHAKLAYPSVGNWLEGKAPIPEKIKQVNGLEKVLLCQHEMAQILKNKRHDLGSLTLAPTKIEAKVNASDAISLELSTHNFAHQLIEEFMICANFVMASHLNKAQIASFRRVVRKPRNWDRIIEVAAKYGEKLPVDPNSKALDEFLIKRKLADPDTFPDISLTIIKLLGRGEYVVECPEEASIGHFGLALADYMHATAPNRRFPDLIAQRQYKAYLHKEQSPYSIKELKQLADHCTEQEDRATKVERQSSKSAAAMLLKHQIGKMFDGIITGSSSKGVWVRIMHPPVEGKIINGSEKLKVGEKVSVKLCFTDVEKGFIDFTI